MGANAELVKLMGPQLDLLLPVLDEKSRRLTLGAVALGVFGWGIDSLFVLMACGLVMYGMVMVAVMRRELGLGTERS